MPNNASARRVKDKKNKDKKSKTDKRADTLPLPKGNTAGVDSVSLSLSSAGLDKSSAGTKENNSLSLSVTGTEQPKESSTLTSSVARKEQAGQGSCLALYERVCKRSGGQDCLRYLHQVEEIIAKHAEDEDESWAEGLRFEHTFSTSLDERILLGRAFRAQCREDNPLISQAELKALSKRESMRSLLEWRRRVLQGEKDFLLSSELDKRIMEDELLVRGPTQDALLKDHALSLAEDESLDTYAAIREANPNAGAKELGALLRAAKVQAALLWRRGIEQGGKQFPLPRSGIDKSAQHTSLEAQPKSDNSTTERYYISLTKEETAPIRIATTTKDYQNDLKDKYR
jgi:hypothetical protein